MVQYKIAMGKNVENKPLALRNSNIGIGINQTVRDTIVQSRLSLHTAEKSSWQQALCCK